jgi:hypothetical protein
MATTTATMASFDRFRSHPLYTFLQSRVSSKESRSSDATLCGMGDNKGSWIISDDDYPEFLTKLHNYLFVTKGRPLNFVEQPRLNAPKPLLIDLDFKFPIDTALTHRFSRTHIRNFIKKITEGTKLFFPIESYEVLQFFVSIRPQAYPGDKRKFVKDGIHIQCPQLCLSNEKQPFIRSWVLEQNGVEEAFGVDDAVGDFVGSEFGFQPAGGRFCAQIKFSFELCLKIALYFTHLSS